MTTLLQSLAGELERRRELSAQVIRYIGRTYGVDGDAIGPFLANELPGLEDDEIDLILSPVFTPKLADQAVFAELLGSESVAREQWPGLIQQLVGRPTRAQLITSDGQAHAVALREVSIERYVHRLRLDGAIPESLFKQVNENPATVDRPLLKAIARRSIWAADGRRAILERYLENTAGRDIYRTADAVDLLNLMESYQPVDIAGLLKRIPLWQQALQREINAGSGPKPFFSQAVQESHGGGRDQRRQDAARQEAKENELAFLGRLQQALGG